MMDDKTVYVVEFGKHVIAVLEHRGDAIDLAYCAAKASGEKCNEQITQLVGDREAINYFDEYGNFVSGAYSYVLGSLEVAKHYIDDMTDYLLSLANNND